MKIGCQHDILGRRACSSLVSMHCCSASAFCCSCCMRCVLALMKLAAVVAGSSSEAIALLSYCSLRRPFWSGCSCACSSHTVAFSAKVGFALAHSWQCSPLTADLLRGDCRVCAESPLLLVIPCGVASEAQLLRAGSPTLRLTCVP